MEQGTRHTLTVAVHENAGVTCVVLQGSLSATTAEQGTQELKKIIDAGAKKVVINLEGVDYISSVGYGCSCWCTNSSATCMGR
ncbi:MAG: STAS domain-containing protein [Nitrospira sp.]